MVLYSPDTVFDLSILFKKGNLLFSKKTEFEHGLTKKKYILIMENYAVEKKTIIGILTTSKLWRLKASGNEGIIVKIQPIGKTLLLCGSYREIAVIPNILKNYKIMGRIKIGDLKRLELAIRKSSIPKGVRERILKAQITVKVKKREQIGEPRNLSLEKLLEIKRRLFGSGR